MRILHQKHHYAGSACFGNLFKSYHGIQELLFVNLQFWTERGSQREKHTDREVDSQADIQRVMHILCVKSIVRVFCWDNGFTVFFENH